MNLNPGGILGGVVAAVVAIAIIFSMEISGRGTGKLAIFVIAGGAFAGNFLWDKIFAEATEVEETPVKKKKVKQAPKLKPLPRLEDE